MAPWQDMRGVERSHSRSMWLGENVLTLDASSLIEFQTCRRKWAINRLWKVLRWHPRSLFSSCMRTALFDLSNGSPLETVRSNARERFMNTAANPGLDLPSGSDPYRIACDFTSMMDTILIAFSRLTMLSLSKHSPVQLSDDVQWEVLSPVDESGMLHRFIFVDSWDNDAIAREVHSWRTCGDAAVCDAPMQFHVTEIGSQRKGRQHTPWIK